MVRPARPARRDLPGRGDRDRPRVHGVTFYVRRGEVPRKRHIWHTDPSGHRLAEELMGEHGFHGASSLLYHHHSPSAITGIEPAEIARPDLGANQPLRPWHFRAGSLARGGDLVTGRRVLMGNSDVIIAWAVADRSSELYRNAAGDELVYVQGGSATLESVFGSLAVTAGDYVVIPASTTHRWVIPDGSPVEALVLEAAGHVSLPARYLTERGQLREGAPFSER